MRLIDADLIKYSEVDDNGEFVRQNIKRNYIATAPDTLAALATLEADAMAHINTEAQQA